MMKIEMLDTKSSSINQIGYDKNKKEVHIYFSNDRKYKYKDVPEMEFYKLKNSKSVGKYFHQSFKNNYQFEKLD